MDLYNPFAPGTDVYSAWHIRTPEGETSTSYDPSMHPYVVREQSSEVCHAFAQALGAARAACGPELMEFDVPVYMSSNRCAVEIGRGRESLREKEGGQGVFSTVIFCC